MRDNSFNEFKQYEFAPDWKSQGTPWLDTKGKYAD